VRSGGSLGFPVLGAPARPDGYDLALPLFLLNACAREKFIGEPQVLTLFLKRRWKGEVIGFRGLSDELQPIAFHNRADKNLGWVQGLRKCRTQDNGQENPTASKGQRWRQPANSGAEGHRIGSVCRGVFRVVVEKSHGSMYLTQLTLPKNLSSLSPLLGVGLPVLLFPSHPSLSSFLLVSHLGFRFPTIHNR